MERGGRDYGGVEPSPFRLDISWAIALAAALAIGGLLWLSPATSRLVDGPWLKAAPYLALALAGILGCVFVQGRVALIALLLAAVTGLTDRAAFLEGDDAKARAVVLLASVQVPVLLAVLRHLRECGLFSAAFAVRAGFVAVSGLVVFLLPEIPSFSRTMGATEALWLRPMSALVPMPLAGFTAFLAAAAVLLIRGEYEPPRVGHRLLVVLLFSAAALNYRSVLWPAEHARLALYLFAAAAAAALLVTAVEHGWREAYMDELTELPGRRALRHHLGRLGAAYVVAMIDVDRFKTINDTHGHRTGDQVLRFIASFLRACPAGRAFRYGGEEFVIVSAEEDLSRVLDRMEALRATIAGRPFVLRGKDRPRRKPRQPRAGTPADAGGKLSVTVSIGVARATPRNSSWSGVLEAADAALYRAKNDGRNCVRSAVT